MKGKQFLISMLVTAILLFFTMGMAIAQPTLTKSLGSGFTYQGQLKSSDTPYSGTCDFQFGLYDELVSGTQIGILSKTNVTVSQGFFTVLLDFGASAFNGDNRWLEISVRCPAGTGDYTLLTPRQLLSATPYALFAKNANNASYASTAPWTGLSGVPAGFSDGVDNDTTYSAGTGLTLSGTTFSANTTYLQRRIIGTCDSGYAIRVVNENGSVTCEAVSGSGTTGWSLTGNAGTTPGTNYLGTSDETALEIKVNGSRVFRFEPNNESPNLIGGYSGNWLLSNLHGVTIAGGGMLDYENRVTDIFGTVSGGVKNQAGNNAGDYLDAMGATIGGGAQNTASGQFSVIGGGASNSANAAAVVSGGTNNTANGKASTIGGGESNIASNQYATISGGYTNSALGDYATVSGGGTNSASSYGASIAGGSTNEANGELSSIGGGMFNYADGMYSTISGGYSNSAPNSQATISGGKQNTASGDNSAIGGGSQNQTSGNWSVISGGLLNNASGYFATIGGGDSNSVTATYGTIAGGGPSDIGDPSFTSNRVTDNYGTVGGGGNNQAGNASGTIEDATYATVAGGRSNSANFYRSTVGGGAFNTAGGIASTVAGGSSNIASGTESMVGGGGGNSSTDTGTTVSGGRSNTASYYAATVGGGQYNIASGWNSTVSGGYYNTASGWNSTVVGGQNNTASGTSSFAAGTRAKALLNGCFVWGDSTDADITCGTANRWIARTSGGVFFYTSPDLSTGVKVDAGGGSWASVSDRNLKENFSVVDTKELLTILAEIPITTWNYKTQDETIRHIGPVAQDFYAAFGVGEDDTHITTIDADGVALAAIQGLYEENQELIARMDDLEARLEALEQGLPSGNIQPSRQSQSSTPWVLVFGFCLIGSAVVLRKRTGGMK